MAKFEAFVAYNEATWRLWKNLFPYNSNSFKRQNITKKMITFLRRNDYFF